MSEVLSRFDLIRIEVANLTLTASLPHPFLPHLCPHPLLRGSHYPLYPSPLPCPTPLFMLSLCIRRDSFGAQVGLDYQISRLNMCLRHLQGKDTIRKCF